MELLVYLKLFSCHCILRMTHLIAKITCACNCYSFQLTSCCSSLKYVDGYPGCHSCINQTEAMWQRKTRMPCYAKGNKYLLKTWVRECGCYASLDSLCAGMWRDENRLWVCHAFLYCFISLLLKVCSLSGHWVCDNYMLLFFFCFFLQYLKNLIRKRACKT